MEKTARVETAFRAAIRIGFSMEWFGSTLTVQDAFELYGFSHSIVV